MDAINLTFNRVLHIITLLQDVCEKKRNQMEKQDSREFQSYLKEWKQKQKRISKITIKEKEQMKQVKATEVKCLKDGMEEIALVDSLIEKARNIRLNHKEPIQTSSISGFKSTHDSSSKKMNLCYFGSQPKKDPILQTECNGKRVLPRSKSALPSTRIKATVVPRSKSANVTILPKDEKTHKCNQISTKPSSTKSAISNSPKQANLRTSETFDSVVISEKDLKEFKKSSHDICDNNSRNTFKGAKSGDFLPRLDCIQDSSLNCFPTYLGFHSNCKKVSSTKNLFKIHKGGFWYPFLNAKHRRFLLEQRNFTSVESLTKAFELLHKIQEVMVWIDILALTGKGVLPGFVFLDKKDVNAVRISQYLRSLYHVTFYKTPLLDFN